MKQRSALGIAAAIIIVAGVGVYLFLHRPVASPTHGAPASTTSSSINNSVLKTRSTASLGQYLTDPSGKPLYTYGSDSSGVSNCRDGCLVNWPAYQATGTAHLPAGVSTLKRTDDGQLQYTYNGLPLYYFANDTAGNPTGNGVEGFTLAKPQAATNSENSSPATPTTTAPSNYPY